MGIFIENLHTLLGLGARCPESEAGRKMEGRKIFSDRCRLGWQPAPGLQPASGRPTYGRLNPMGNGMLAALLEFFYPSFFCLSRACARRAVSSRRVRAGWGLTPLSPVRDAPCRPIEAGRKMEGRKIFFRSMSVGLAACSRASARLRPASLRASESHGEWDAGRPSRIFLPLIFLPQQGLCKEGGLVAPGSGGLGLSRLSALCAMLPAVLLRRVGRWRAERFFSELWGLGWRPAPGF